MYKRQALTGTYAGPASSWPFQVAARQLRRLLAASWGLLEAELRLLLLRAASGPLRLLRPFRTAALHCVALRAQWRVRCTWLLGLRDIVGDGGCVPVDDKLSTLQVAGHALSILPVCVLQQGHSISTNLRQLGGAGNACKWVLARVARHGAVAGARCMCYNEQ